MNGTTKVVSDIILFNFRGAVHFFAVPLVKSLFFLGHERCHFVSKTDGVLRQNTFHQ